MKRGAFYLGDDSDAMFSLDYWVSEFDHVFSPEGYDITSDVIGLGRDEYDNLKHVLVAELNSLDPCTTKSIYELEGFRNYSLENTRLVKHVIKLIIDIQNGQDFLFVYDQDIDSECKENIVKYIAKVQLFGDKISLS